MLDMQLPRPLLDPSLWLSRTGRTDLIKYEEILIGMDHLRYGGAFARLRKPSSAKRIRFSVPENFWSQISPKEQSLVALLQNEFQSLKADPKSGIEIEFEIVSRRSLSGSELSEWKNLATRTGRTVHFKTWPDLTMPSLLDWSKEIFPETFAKAVEINWHRDLKEYEAQLKPSSPTMDALRFWPGFLMAKKQGLAELAGVEWARAQALFSPQDDTQEAAGETALLNPTLQIVTAPLKESLIAIWRVDDALASREITWEEAAIIDELRESPRTGLLQLKDEITAKRFPLKTKANFQSVIDLMIQAGLILRRQ
jgi:hypothetical protein